MENRRRGARGPHRVRGIAIDTAHDPTSHNLRPLEILEFGSAALAIIGVLKLARRFLKVPA
ncbi:MAG TPA: hypothetical protein VN692_00405 [Steroidobacteraceae bacterium]|nr:hypothetical protein [Steroidobacteraceae bacterium]